MSQLSSRHKVEVMVADESTTESSAPSAFSARFTGNPAPQPTGAPAPQPTGAPAPAPQPTGGRKEIMAGDAHWDNDLDCCVCADPECVAEYTRKMAHRRAEEDRRVAQARSQVAAARAAATPSPAATGARSSSDMDGYLEWKRQRDQAEASRILEEARYRKSQESNFLGSPSSWRFDPMTGAPRQGMGTQYVHCDRCSTGCESCFNTGFRPGAATGAPAPQPTGAQAPAPAPATGAPAPSPAAPATGSYRRNHTSFTLY